MTSITLFNDEPSVIPLPIHTEEFSSELNDTINAFFDTLKHQSGILAGEYGLNYYVDGINNNTIFHSIILNGNDLVNDEGEVYNNEKIHIIINEMIEDLVFSIENDDN